MSGGERQRIALARAFLKDAPLLIMDEPTSSVDIETESLILDAMVRLMKGRTTFMIAHRLTTLESSDLLLILEAGRLVAVESEVRAAIARALAEGSLRPPRPASESRPSVPRPLSARSRAERALWRRARRLPR